MILYVGNMHSTIATQLTQVRHFCFSPDPKRRAYMPHGRKVLLDSGAFQDVRRTRLNYAQALDRQLEYEHKNNFIAERIVSYDVLIDEQMQSDRQCKIRWDESAAWSAVSATLAAAEYLAARRAELAPRQLVLSAQGVSAEQYIACMRDLLQIAAPQDCIGLGGWCIVGQRRHLMKLFWDAMDVVLPMVAAQNTDVHLFGVTYMPLLKEFAMRCRELGLNASTDTTRFYFELTRGRVFDERSGISKYFRGSGNLARHAPTVIANVERAYTFVRNIENWTPEGALF